MLSFWIFAALLTVLAVVAVARPLMTRKSAAEAEPREAADVALYRDQIAEIETDRTRGLISDTEAEAARIEIARRLIASAGTNDADGTSTGRDADRKTGSDKLFMAVAAIVPLVALILYGALGSPNLPGRPVAERLAQSPGAGAAIEELVARVEAQLRANPGDGQGWDVLAPVYLRLERFQDAADAFKRAIDTLGESPRRLAGLAQSTMMANDGIVTEVARQAYQRLLELEPGRIEAQIGLALAKEQEGDLDEAEKRYRQVNDSTPPDAPWRGFVTERLDALVERRTGHPKTSAPEQRDAAADQIAGMPEPERREMILKMVEGLSERLNANGKDAEGWQRLIRSWTVLGDTAKAEAALAQARKALAGDDKALGEINAVAKSLGLKS